jgi:hypothetical protein
MPRPSNVVALLLVTLHTEAFRVTVSAPGAPSACVRAVRRGSSGRRCSGPRGDDDDEVAADDVGRDEGQKVIRDFHKQVENSEEEMPSSSSTERSSEMPAGVVGSSLFSEEPAKPTPAVDRIRDRELRLTGIFERTLPIQAAALFAAIVFVGYIGLSGGITDGSDRFFDGDETEFIGGSYVEQIRSDTDSTRPFDGIEVTRSGIWL